MSADILVLLFNGFCLALTLAFLLIALWYDTRNQNTQYFALFLFLVALWNAGFSLGQIFEFIVIEQDAFRLMVSLMIQTGFGGTSLIAYVFLSRLAAVFPRRLQFITLLSLIILSLMNSLWVISGASLRLIPIGQAIYLFFDTATLYVAWRYGRKIRAKGALVGVSLFALGHILATLNANYAVLALLICNIALLVSALSMTRQSLLVPFMQSKNQLETMYDVSLVISSQLSPQKVMDEIAQGATRWLKADAAGIFLQRDDMLELVAIENFPSAFLHERIPVGEGVVGTVAQQRNTLFFEDYGRDWRGLRDLPLAHETFGAVICTPLLYHDTVLGVLLIVAGKQGRIFDSEDAHQVELLGAQAAVAISNGELFEEQKELDRIKSEMIRMTSHDLKNPLQAAIANLELLRDDLSVEQLRDSEIALSINNIQRQLERMTRIISGILDVERARTGIKLDEECDLNELCQAALDELMSLIKDRQVRIHLALQNPLPSFLGDKAQFQRAIVNLIENAIKFSQAMQQIIVRTSLEQGELRCAVEDEGVGIPSTLHEQIFERFFRGQQAGVEHVSGSGLGLSLVKAVVESHHGRVWVESDIGHGAKFTIAVRPQMSIAES